MEIDHFKPLKALSGVLSLRIQRTIHSVQHNKLEAQDVGIYHVG